MPCLVAVLCSIFPTLLAPSDYRGEVYYVTFHVGNTTAMVNIPIVDDDLYEGKADPESFRCVLHTRRTLEYSTSVRADATATVFIHDNEGMHG